MKATPLTMETLTFGGTFLLTIFFDEFQLPSCTLISTSTCHAVKLIFIVAQQEPVGDPKFNCLLKKGKVKVLPSNVHRLLYINSIRTSTATTAMINIIDTGRKYMSAIDCDACIGSVVGSPSGLTLKTVTA